MNGPAFLTTAPAPYVTPYDWPLLLAFFRARAIEGLEEVDDAVYRRVVLVAGRAGTVEVCNEPGASRLLVSTTLPPDAMGEVLPCVRRAFDTETNPRDVSRHLSRDPVLAPIVASRPGLRVPGSWSPFELGVRAVLGQQITVAAARKLGAKLVALCASGSGSLESSFILSRVFPSPQQVLAADLEQIGMPRARRTAVRRVAEAFMAGPHAFEAAASLEDTVARLRRIGGVGEWTAQYIAMRALRSPDAFPATDVGLLRGAAAIMGQRPTARELLAHAERWRPWRAYAAQHLWSIDPTLGGKTRHTEHGHD